jgi:TPR repeat protein
MFQLAETYVILDTEPDPYAAKILWTLEAARRGHVKAMLAMASAYYGGTGVPRDEAQARAWADRAAGTGNPEALMVRRALFPE